MKTIALLLVLAACGVVPAGAPDASPLLSCSCPFACGTFTAMECALDGDAAPAATRALAACEGHASMAHCEPSGCSACTCEPSSLPAEGCP